ncbi:MAG: discoidin domain-containing protein [Verrucomicrobiota bacterium]|nr:discoidin domain-containing protein [Verrucomicrobiota bacterium]
MKPQLILVATAFLTISSTTSAEYIPGVTATTNMGSGFGTNLQNTVNAVGLSSPSLSATHAGTTPFNSWVSQQNAFTGVITFDLGGRYPVDGFSFWNQNGGGPGPLGSSGIRDVEVLFSLDGSTFAPLLGGPAAFARVTGSTNLAPEIFSFTPVDATHFRFNVLSNWGDPLQVGFAEVAFSAVPEPGAAGFCFLAIATPLLSRIRRRRGA